MEANKQHGHTYHQPPPTLVAERRWFPWLVPVFVTANIAMFVLSLYVNDCPGHSSRVAGGCVGEEHLHRFAFEPLSRNPLFGPSSHALKQLGALEWDKVVNKHQGWRLVSCIWLHAGVIHLFINMLSLCFIGVGIEKQFGFFRVGIVYILSGFGGSVMSSLFIRNRVSVGASGALFGLLGSTLSELITNWSMYSNKASAVFSIIIIIVINLAVGMLPYVDNFAHIGGFLTGYLLGFIVMMRPQLKWILNHHLPCWKRLQYKYKAYQLLFWIAALIMVFVWFVVGIDMLFKGENGNRHCSWCHYLSCIPTAKWQCD